MALYLSKVVLENVRAFQRAEIDFGDTRKPRRWTVVIGNNGHGKSTLLRAIAIGLCDEKTAGALLLKLSGDFIRRNKKGISADEAKIEVTLTSGGKDAQEYRVVTTIKRDPSGQVIVRKETDLPAWDDLFVCGYGVNRGTRGTASRATYSAVHALESLFDDRVDLLDPESVLRDLKLSGYVREEQQGSKKATGNAPFEAARKCLWTLWGMNPNHRLEITEKAGVIVHGPWGGMPFHALGDGYRGTAGWVLDLLGNALKAGRWSGGELTAIVLMDEVDEHMHPRWQKTIIPALKKLFPGVQFVATTHSPLTLVNTKRGEVVATTLHNTIAEIDPDPLPSPEGKTANEILQGEWFGLTSTLDEKSEKRLVSYRKAVVEGRTEEAGKLREELRGRIGSFLTSPMDELAIEIADEARRQIRAAKSPGERQKLVAEAAARLKAKLAKGARK